MNTPKRRTLAEADAWHARRLRELDETCRSWTEYEAAVEREEVRHLFERMEIEGDEDWRDYDEDIPY